MQTHVLILLCLAFSLTACGTERIIEKPVPVEIVRIETMPVPDDLLRPGVKKDIPDGMTYGQAIESWAADRFTIDKLNGQLKAISVLE